MTTKRTRSTATPLPRPRVTDAVRLAALLACDEGFLLCRDCPVRNLNRCRFANREAIRILRAAGVKLRGKP
jgi:hypothetical protein